MAPTTWFRYVLNRLSFFTKPLPLVSSLLVVILAVFVWEKASHPEWFGTYLEEEAPSEGPDLSGLTPQEQAAVADIDNLSVLLNDLGLVMDGPVGLQAAPEPEVLEDAQGLLEQDLLAPSEPTEAELTRASSNPFDQYLEQYQFRGGTPPAELPEAVSSFDVQSGVGLFQGLSQSNRSASVNPLQKALQEQSLLGTADAPASPFTAGSTATETTNPEISRQDTGPQTGLPRNTVPAVTDEGAVSESGSGSASAQQNSQSVNVPGVSFPVLPATVQTSPPPGTTGYKPPAALGNPSLPASNAAIPGFPVGGSSVPNPGAGANAGAGVPIVPTATSNPNLSVPQVNVGNNTLQPIVPAAPTGNSVPPVSPSNFAVPRPPGSVIGGGYINTFSNPSAPPEATP